VEDLATSDLTKHQTEELDPTAESAKLRRLFPKVQKKTAERMSVDAATEITKTLNHRIDVNDRSVALEKLNAKEPVNEAVEQGFEPAERI